MDEALAQIQRAVELDPLSVVINATLGAILAGLGRFHEAEAFCRRAITIDPFFPGPYLELAALDAYAFNHFADAVPLAEKAIELDLGNPWPSDTLASLSFDLGDDHTFFATTAQAAKRWPNDPRIQFWIALVHLIRLDMVGAVRQAQRALGAYPRGREALAILRNAALQNGQYDTALAHYEKAYPELFVQGAPRLDGSNYGAAIDLALVAQRRGDSERADVLLDGAARVIRTIPRLGASGYGIADAQIHALRGQKANALAALRDAEKAGWRGPGWRYFRDFEPNLASIRNEPAFKAVFAEIERDMARQRAELAARPKDARLDLAPARS